MAKAAKMRFRKMALRELGVPDVPGVALFDWLWFALHDANVQNLAATHQDYGGREGRLMKNPH